MNYYRRYVGDYMRDTSHLSLAEHGAYTILLDTLYATEKPLPADAEKLYRICRATTDDERAAVQSVADEFFPVDDGERWNPRAQIEIESGQKRIQAAKQNGTRGGRPKKPNKNPVGLQNGTQPLTGSKAIQPPTTSNKPKPTTAAVASDEFDAAWVTYPSRSGGNPKARAAKAWAARVRSGHDPPDILAGVQRYRRFCDATGKTGTEFVMQAATFFGPDERFSETWEIPGEEVQRRSPAGHDATSRPSALDRVRAATGT